MKAALLALLLPILAWPTSASAAAVPRARIKTGLVSGSPTAGVDRFLGIPYGAPPISALLWRASQLARKWARVR
jgi:hypothetical protein